MFIDVRELEELTTDECLRHLAKGRVGRVAFTTSALPMAVPVTYVLRGQFLLLATAADSRLARAADHSVLAFEIDEVDLDAHTGWSVVVTGVAEVVADQEDGPSRLRRRAVAARTRGPAIRLACTRVTGRRIVVANRERAGS